MNGQKKTGKKIYDTYRPYPVSFDSRDNVYSGEPPGDGLPRPGDGGISDFFQDSDTPFSDRDPVNPLQTKPLPSNSDTGFSDQRQSFLPSGDS